MTTSNVPVISLEISHMKRILQRMHEMFPLSKGADHGA